MPPRRTQAAALPAAAAPPPPVAHAAADVCHGSNAAASGAHHMPGKPVVTGGGGRAGHSAATDLCPAAFFFAGSDFQVTNVCFMLAFESTIVGKCIIWSICRKRKTERFRKMLYRRLTCQGVKEGHLKNVGPEEVACSRYFLREYQSQIL